MATGKVRAGRVNAGDDSTTRGTTSSDFGFCTMASGNVLAARVDGGGDPTTGGKTSSDFGFRISDFGFSLVVG